MKPKIVETRNSYGVKTGHWRLIGIPGDFMDLPGRGGKVTRDAAAAAIAVFERGGTWVDAFRATLDY